jgi:hypothetical protein
MNYKHTAAYLITIVLIGLLLALGISLSTANSDTPISSLSPPPPNAAPLVQPSSAATYHLSPLADDPTSPTATVKLVFIHHSCGDAWLEVGNGDLGNQLGANNFYVSDTYYDWGPDDIGSYTDIGDWWSWFRGSNSITYTQAVYSTTNQHASYTRPMADPGGENQIVMFKSCYPNSHLGGSPADPPTTGANPLRGEDYTSEHHTVGNAKGIYNDILEYFRTRRSLSRRISPRQRGRL